MTDNKEESIKVVRTEKTIGSCTECPNHSLVYKDLEDTDTSIFGTLISVCLFKYQGVRKIENWCYIPEWCPLEDYKSKDEGEG